MAKSRVLTSQNDHVEKKITLSLRRKKKNERSANLSVPRPSHVSHFLLSDLRGFWAIHTIVANHDCRKKSHQHAEKYKGWPSHFSLCLQCLSNLQREKWTGHPLLYTGWWTHWKQYGRHYKRKEKNAISCRIACKLFSISAHRLQGFLQFNGTFPQLGFATVE